MTDLVIKYELKWCDNRQYGRPLEIATAHNFNPVLLPLFAPFQINGLEDRRQPRKTVPFCSVTLDRPCRKV